MMLFGNKKIAKKDPVEVKLSGIDFGPYYDLMYNAKNYSNNDAPYITYDYVMPVRDAVDRIADAYSSLVVNVDIDNASIVPTDADQIKILLQNPSENTTKLSFNHTIMKSQLLTNEIWIIARGNPAELPKELDAIPASAITMVFGSGYNKFYDINKFPSEIIVNEEYCQKTYRPDKSMLMGGEIRYFDDSGLSELWYGVHSKSGDAMGEDGFRGRSRLMAVKKEIDEYNEMIVSSISILRQNASPSIFGWPKEPIDPVLMGQFVENLRKTLNGAQNAGKPVLVHQPLEMQQITPRKVSDLDYQTVTDAAMRAVYNIYRIPMAMIATDAMTKSNFENSTPSFYHNAVFPQADIVLDTLALHLSRRINGTVQFKIDKMQVDAIRTEKINQTATLAASGFLTINELRAMSGYDPIDGGDVVIGRGISETEEQP